MPGRRQKPVGQFPVIRYKKQPLRILIQASHRKQFPVKQRVFLFPHQIQNCFVMIIPGCADISGRLMEHEIHIFPIGNLTAVYTDTIRIFINFLFRAFCRYPVDRHSPLFYKRLNLAPCSGFHFT